MPPFKIALAYQALFRVPVSELFPGKYEAVKQDVEARLAKMAENLHNRTAKGREASMIARKLEWIWERENQENASLFNGNGHA